MYGLHWRRARVAARCIVVRYCHAVLIIYATAAMVFELLLLCCAAIAVAWKPMHVVEIAVGTVPLHGDSKLYMY